MITGFFDDGYGLGIKPRIVIKANGQNKSTMIVDGKEQTKHKESVPIVDGNYVFMTSKVLTPWDLKQK